MHLINRTGSHDDQPWPRAATLLTFLAVVVVVAFSVICGSVLFEIRRNNWEMARQASDNLVSTIEADIGRNLELCHSALKSGRHQHG